ncbi:MAG TPA: hypothetical protein VMZ06_10355 [Candidatus Bathyarchaeia archaeon]|nr:hypothetical protein [Candidatus Bathyarchaeia archaeon]
MKHVKSTTRQTPVKAQAFNPYQEKKGRLFGPFMADGTFTK